MTIDEKIKRINELYHLSKERPLTPEEASEQKSLREDYIKAIRVSLTSQLENMEIKELDGTITKVTKKQH